MLALVLAVARAGAAQPVPTPAPAPAAAAVATGDSDLDVLMARVLERRNETWRALHDYVLDERERFGLTGPADLRLFGSDRAYTWYVRDGVLVRSPVKANGVPVPEAERRAYEARWIAEEQGRAAKAARKGGEPADGAPAEVAPTSSATEQATKSLEPRFVSEAYFLRFRFEKGRYLLAGRETIDGRPVLKVEYYPTNLFRDQEHKDEPKPAAAGEPPAPANRKPRRKGKDGNAAETDAEKALERDVERKLNKTALVTIWIDPAEQQIVRYVFENLGYDFLPAQWLVRVGETTASMTMGRYFDGVWLPKTIEMHADVQLAIGSFEGEYAREFLQYRKAETSARIRYGDVK